MKAETEDMLKLIAFQLRATGLIKTAECIELAIENEYKDSADDRDTDVEFLSDIGS